MAKIFGRRDGHLMTFTVFNSMNVELTFRLRSTIKFLRFVGVFYAGKILTLK